MSRLRTNFITNRMANGAPTVSNGLVVSGVTTTTSLNVTGNVSVGGTLTYEDVTNIDSVGMITARTDITLGDSIIHLNDTNTKIRFPANDTISFDTAGSERIRIASDGVITGRGELRLTEGTTDVSQGAEIGSLMFLNPANDNKNAKIAALRTTGTSGADLAFYTRTHGDATNDDGGIEKLRITSAGRVGIGTDIPATLLHLFGSGGTEKLIRLDSTSHKRNNFIGITGSDNLVLGADEDNEGSGSTIRFRIDGSEKVRITSGGRVAIGTDSGGNNDTDDIVVSGSGKRGITVCSTDGSECRLTFADGLSGVNAVAGNITYDHSVDRMDFYTNTTRRVSITNTGRVGIGLTNPQRQLHIVGNDGPTGATLGNSDTCLIIDNKQSNGAIVEFLSDNNGAARLMFTDTDGYNRGRVEYMHSSDSMNFHTAGTERMSISSAGYVSGNINVPCWFGSQDTQHNITNGTWTTLINLGNNVVNPSMNNSGWNESTGVFTVQEGQAGTYFCYAGGGIDDVQDSDVVRIGISKNDASPSIFAEQRCLDQGANVVVPSGTMTQLFTVAVGDTLRAKIYHNEGSTEPTEPNRCFFGGYRLSV